VATVRDCYGSPVPGVPVVLTAADLVSLPGAERSVQLTTGADGTVRTRVFAGLTPGTTSVTARASSVGSREARFALTVGPPEADLAVSLSLPAAIDRHAQTEVRVTVRSNGPSPSGAWTAQVVVPHGLKPQDLGGGTRVGDVITWTGPSLAAGAQVQRVLTVRSRGKGLTTVSASARGPVLDPHPDNDTAVVSAVIG
jgi:hypothetical protein